MPSFRCRRVVLVVLDGLRPDAIDAFSLLHLLALEGAGASTRTATTVAPSVTAAAMGSLLTGVPPQMHGLTSDRFHIPRPTGTVHPLPATLLAAGFTTSAFLARPHLLYRRLA
jgi:predicted AlkP superfamily phosphohydrolase/phosphomutase